MRKLEASSKGNFVLFVSNQSAGVTPVDIRVSIDGALAINEEFHKGGGHQWKEFRFQLATGEHVLTASSTKGRVTYEKRFVVTGTHWAAIGYFNSPGGKSGVKIDPTFNFTMQDKPIRFD